MEGIILERIKDFLVQKFDCKKSDLKTSTSLYHDLGITGEDTDYFIIDFAKEFNISLQNIDLKDYDIGVENFDIIGRISNLIRGQKKKTITLLDLERAVNTGKFT